MIKHREALPRSYLPASLEDEHFWVFVFGVLDLMEVYIYIYIYRVRTFHALRKEPTDVPHVSPM